MKNMMIVECVKLKIKCHVIISTIIYPLMHFRMSHSTFTNTVQI